MSIKDSDRKVFINKLLLFLDHEFLVPESGTSKDDHHNSHREPDSQRMTNADFRKMMMTPRTDKNMTAMGALALGAGNSTLGGPPASSNTSGRPRVSSVGSSGSGSTSENKELSEKAEKRKKKKSFYAKLKRQEDDKMAELAAKYRDRAAERRDGIPDKPDNSRDGEESESTTQKAASHTSQTGGGYRAVAPDIKSSHDQAERRRQMIQESKFLGGDMEHTHLVKGLDFALLQKVRSEITSREKVNIDEDIEETAEVTPKLGNRKDRREAERNNKFKENDFDLKRQKEVKKELKTEDSEDQVVCRTTMAKNIVRTVFKTDVPERNELFFPGRMAYTMDLDEIEESQDDPESANPHSDIPTTTIRSKADVQGNLAHQQAVSLSANDIVINKLTQILSYLRAAGSRGKKKKKDKLLPQLPNPKTDPVAAAAVSKGQAADIPIFDDTGDYVPDYHKRNDKTSTSGLSSRDRDRERRDRDKGYSRSGHRDRERDRDRRAEKGSSRSYFDKHDEEEEPKKGFSNQDKEMIKNMLKREEEKTKKEEGIQNEASLGQITGTYLSANNGVGFSVCYRGIDTCYAMVDSIFGI